MKGTAFSRALKDARMSIGWSRSKAYFELGKMYVDKEPFSFNAFEKWERGKLPVIENVVILARLYKSSWLIESRLKECEGYAELKILSSAT